MHSTLGPIHEPICILTHLKLNVRRFEIMFVLLPVDIRLDIWRKARRLIAEEVLSRHLSFIQDRRALCFCIPLSKPDTGYKLFHFETWFRIADDKLMVIIDSNFERAIDVYTIRPAEIESYKEYMISCNLHLLRYVGSNIIIDRWYNRREPGVTPISRTALRALNQMRAANRTQNDHGTISNGLVHIFRMIRRLMSKGTLIVIHAFHLVCHCT